MCQHFAVGLHPRSKVKGSQAQLLWLKLAMGGGVACSGPNFFAVCDKDERWAQQCLQQRNIQRSQDRRVGRVHCDSNVVLGRDFTTASRLCKKLVEASGICHLHRPYKGAVDWAHTAWDP
jgi:hypothetical protein